MTEAKNNYQHTLNLPTTKFPMKANLAYRELEMLNFWKSEEIYEKIQKKNCQKPFFILHDGPPYANGHIHIGHAVNKILKDIIIKAKALSGYATPYIPGWDCHGLPIELNVEKKIGKAGKEVSSIEFVHACRNYATEQWQQQRNEFIRLGVFADWPHPYLTMDYAFEANIIRTLAKIYQNGFVQQGQKPVYWCTECSSALAEAEVEYENKKSIAIDVKFPFVDNHQLFNQMNKMVAIIDLPKNSLAKISVIIWTTTPWTLPANQAVALHPTHSYALVKHNDEYFILAEELLTQCMDRYGFNQYQVLGHCQGKNLEGLMLQHPFYQRQIPIVLGEHVNLDSGTGAVHTAPVYGIDDYVLGIKYQLPIENYLNNQGVFLPSTPFFASLHLNAANPQIIEVLIKNQQLVLQKDIEHSYPHCWRHKKPLIFMATPQWFISMDAHQLRNKVLDAINKVEWIPEWGKNRIYAMIAERPDWCISRQRTWGVPLSIFLHKETAKPHPQTATLMEIVSQFVEKNGLEIWLALRNKQESTALSTPVNQLQQALNAVAGEELFENYYPIADTLDVWFNSGASYACVLQKNPHLAFPADLYLEGSDQHRGWFHTSLLSAMAHSQHPPYRQVLTHGFAVDEKGRKMSKSLGNVIAPEKVIKTFGADILRLWVSSTDYRAEIAVSEQILQRTADSYRRIRNTSRFLLANLFDFVPNQHLLPFDTLLSLDRYIINYAAELQEKIIAHYTLYEFHHIFQKIHYFCSEILGSFYLDVIKDRQYTMPANSHGRRSAQTAMFHIAQALCRWMAPILSFTAEEIWQHLPKQEFTSVFLTEWYTMLEKRNIDKIQENSADIDWRLILAVREKANKKIEELRNQGLLGSALEAEVILYGNDEVVASLSRLGNELKFALITSAVHIKPLLTKENLVDMKDSADFVIEVKVLTAPKCQRCWHRSEEVNQHAEYPGLCLRCVNNINGEGENRQFV